MIRSSKPGYLATTRAERLQRRIRNHAQEPRPERALSIKAMDASKRGEKGIRHDIFRELRISGDQRSHSERFSLLSQHERSQTCRIASLTETNGRLLVEIVKSHDVPVLSTP